MKRHVVHARRVGSWWALDVEGVNGAHTQVRRIDQAAEMARDAIAGVLDVARDSFEVSIVPVVPAAVRTVIDDATHARSQAVQAQDAATRLMREAAQRLIDEGLTVRDAGVLLGVSHQRIAQLLAGGLREPWRSASMGANIDIEDKEAVRRTTEAP